jgi:hypothetical protein
MGQSLWNALQETVVQYLMERNATIRECLNLYNNRLSTWILIEYMEK